MSRSSSPADLLVISHAGDRSGAPIVLLRFLEWLRANTTLEPRVVLLHGGSMEAEFARFGARIIGGADSRLWMIQRGLTNLDFDKAASALALLRQGPTMWWNRKVPVVLMNSVGSLPALRFLPQDSEAKVVLYVHELDDSFERTIGTSAWELLSPRVDHFVTCGARVTEMLIERRGIPADRVSEHHGFVDAPHPDPEAAARVRRDLGISPEALVIGGSGQPEWRKGPEVMVQVLRTLRDRRPDLDAHVIWMGGEPDSSPGWKLAHDVRTAGLTDRFHHVGEVVDTAAVMGAVDLFALTSREDPYPLVVLEAASLGVPVVSFDNGGIVQFARSGGDAPLAEVVPYLDVDAMVDVAARLLDDGDAREALARRARAHVLANHLTDQAAPRLFETLAQREPGLRETLLEAPRPVVVR